MSYKRTLIEICRLLEEIQEELDATNASMRVLKQRLRYYTIDPFSPLLFVWRVLLRSYFSFSRNSKSLFSARLSSILLLKGLNRFLMPFTDPCHRCGLGIPRARLDECPICQRAVVQKKTAEDAVVQNKTAEDPIKILKLRLAKGEISKEEFEDLKKSVES